MVLFKMNVGNLDDAGGASCLLHPIVLTMHSIDVSHMIGMLTLSEKSLLP